MSPDDICFFLSGNAQLQKQLFLSGNAQLQKQLKCQCPQFNINIMVHLYFTNNIFLVDSLNVS